MLANLSFKAKLLFLLITAVLGFVIVTFVAMGGLSSQQKANNELRNLSKIQASNDQVRIHMLEIADSIRSISVDNYDDYLASANKQIEKNGSLISTSIERAHSQALKQVLEEDLIKINDYSQALIALINKRYIIGFDSSSGLRGNIDKMGTQISEDINKLSLLKREFTNVRKGEASYLSDPTESNLEEFTSSFTRFDTRIENFGFQDTHGVKANAYRDALLQYGKEYQTLNDTEAEFTAKKNEFDEGQLKANQLINENILQAEADAETSSAQANATLLGVSIAVSIAAALLMITIGRSVNSTLHNIITDLNKVKQGDMSSKSLVNKKRNDEFDQLSQSLNEMTDGLGNVLKDVVSTTSHVSTMSTDLNSTILSITNSNHLVNQRTHSLASATDDISSRLNELSSTTNTLRSHSNETYQSAKSGADTIQMVLNSITDTVNIVNITSQQLNELGRLSKNIDNVIAMINDLASQTNLLALNAAIEAARAGEAGRGFSVVADEVRALAEKTVDATSKITDIVNTIQHSTQTAITTMESGQDNLKIISENGSKAEEAMRDIESNAMTGSQSTDSMANAIQEVASTAIQMSAEMEQIAKQLNEDTRSINIMADKTKQIQQVSEQLADKTQVFTLV
ncbi:methyl-accepting chemotaxis protein [Marinomonas primoryensis]|uniref:Methyl-accepting chemotaxis protein n=1 Tax=Marinomonas primoryensis TaxID=178399 RepID=A0A859D0P3_9GAMM|nr:methyl-accepting chemotaxis protein [Marinomonas primoryensis]QKK82408.1 methyl-accepting chemotaxis protein [Marinomonas primoryensis]|tara:strand:- start:236295 stop:238181 length:1887 start_codon:yes stop_codon:yes gene_type:complete